jgi:mevalonate kinase
MNDRLGDLPSWAMEEAQNEVDFENEPPPTSNGKKKKSKASASSDDWAGDVEMGKTNSQPKHMEHFFREVESIKTDIEYVKKAAKTIGDINEATLAATTTEEENKLSEKMRPLVDKTNKRARRTKDLLGLLKEETKKLEAEDNIKQSDHRYVATQ